MSPRIGWRSTESHKRLKIIRNWLARKLRITETNDNRVKYFQYSDNKEVWPYNKGELTTASLVDIQFSWLYLESGYFDEGADEFSNPEDKGFHITFLITYWYGPLNIQGIEERYREIVYDDYKRPLGTKYYVVVKDPSYVSQLQELYLVHAWKESVKNA